MKKFTIIALLILATIVGVSLITSCATQEVTKTLTKTEGVTTVYFDREAPIIPHYYILEVDWLSKLAPATPLCFECHPIPDQHEGWLQDVDLCLECHEISDNPVLYR